jgi:serine/threonine protein kinase
LDYAHEQGKVHRDIKPDNILLDSKGSPRVVDFGIAKTVEGTRMTGGMIGTPEYMSPEQARGEALDGRADQYALAIVVYEMLTGTTPFRSDTAQAWSLVNAHITVQPPDPRQYQGDLPEHVVVSLMQAMAKMPENRFLTCTQFADALNGYVEFTIPSVKKQGMMGFLGAMVGILLLGGVLLIFGQKDRGNNPPDKPQETSIAAPPPQPPSENVISEPVPDTTTPVEDQTQVDPPVDKSKYLWLLERPVTESDMQGMSKKELEIMRNDVYASHGWIFKRQDLRDYYYKQPWYKPGGTPSQRDVVNNNINYNMSKLEKANTAKILAYEKALGGE